MWKFLYQCASPQFFYKQAKYWILSFGWLAFILLVTGMIWALGFTPPDYQQGDAFKIIYIHVPSAFMSLMLYGFIGFCAILVLVWRIKLAGIMLGGAARLGACMTFIALVTGSVWGKPMWGAWWVWDARLTSELILFFMYIAIIAISYSFQNKEQGDKVTAMLGLIGVIDLPIIHYSVYWWNTLHQGATLSLFAKPKIHISMLYPLIIMIFGFMFYSALVVLSWARNEILLRERKQSWVKLLVSKQYESSY